MILDDSDKNFFVKIARDMIYSELTGSESPKFYKSKEIYGQKIGLFIKVLLKNKIRAYGGILVPEQPLIETIQDLIIKICFHDTRFGSIQPEELDDLKFQFAFIDSLDDISSRQLIKPDIHGVLIEAQGRRGISLPWDFEELKLDNDKYIFETAFKAGIDDLDKAKYTVFKMTTLKE